MRSFGHLSATPRKPSASSARTTATPTASESPARKPAPCSKRQPSENVRLPAGDRGPRARRAGRVRPSAIRRRARRRWMSRRCARRRSSEDVESIWSTTSTASGSVRMRPSALARERRADPSARRGNRAPRAAGSRDPCIRSSARPAASASFSTCETRARVSPTFAARSSPEWNSPSASWRSSENPRGVSTDKPGSQDKVSHFTRTKVRAGSCTIPPGCTGCAGAAATCNGDGQPGDCSPGCARVQLAFGAAPPLAGAARDRRRRRPSPPSSQRPPVPRRDRAAGRLDDRNQRLHVVGAASDASMTTSISPIASRQYA